MLIDNVIKFIKQPEHHIDRQTGYYSPLVKFIYFVPYDISVIDEVYLINIAWDNALDHENREAWNV